MSSQTAPNFCSQCGTSLDPGDAFCPRCGTAVRDPPGRTAASDDPLGSAGGATRHATGRSGVSGRQRADLRRRVEARAVDGWDVKRDYGDRVVMVNRGIGSVAVHALLLATTSGVGNLLYAWYSYSPGADRLELRADGTERRSDDRRTRGDSTGWTAASAVGVAAGLSLAVALAVAGLLVLWLSSSLALTGVGFALWLAGVAAVPLSTQFAPGFESATTFGRKRTVDERVVEAPDTPCSACARPVETGVARTFAEKRYLAGIPVRTENEGENSYCRACANGEAVSAAEGPSADREAWGPERESDREFA